MPAEGDSQKSSYGIALGDISKAFRSVVHNVQEGYKEAERARVQTVERAAQGGLMTAHPRERLLGTETQLTGDGNPATKATPLTTDAADLVKPLQQQMLQETINKARELTEEYTLILNLLHITEHQTFVKLFSGLFSSTRRGESYQTLMNRYWHGTHDFPPKDKILEFIDKVNRYKPKDGALSQYSQELIEAFEPLARAADELARAMKLVPVLEYIYRELSRRPFNPNISGLEFYSQQGLPVLDRIQQELESISTYKRELGFYFNDMGDFDHPLNINKLNKHYENLLCDVPLLKTISDKYHKLAGKIKAAKVEEELPVVLNSQLMIGEHEERLSIESLQIDVKSIKSSTIKQTLSEYASGLIRGRNQRIEDKTKEAKEVSDRAERDFARWQGRINRVNQMLREAREEDLTYSSRGSLFPEHCELPTVEAVHQLNTKIDSTREALKEWPSAIDSLKKKYELNSHTASLKVMRNFAVEARLKETYEAKTIAADGFAQMVGEYKTFIEKNWDAVASDCKFITARGEVRQKTLAEEQGEWDLKLFFYKRAEEKKKEFFSFFRRSYFSADKSYTWNDVCQHLHGNNKKMLFFGYHGGRSKRILQNLGWLSADNKVTEQAPQELKRNMDIVNSYSGKSVSFT